MALTADQIRAAALPKPETVNVPELGGDVCIRVLSALERGDFESWASETKPEEQDLLGRWYVEYRMRLVAACLSNEAGATLGVTGDDVGRLPWPVVLRLWDVADRLNAVTQKAQETIAGKSAAAQSGASSSGSASPSGSSTQTV